MNYSETTITRPVRWDEEYELDIGTSGDCLWISLDPEIPVTMGMDEPDKLSPTPKPSVYVSQEFKQVAGMNTQGEDLIFSVALSKTSPVDISIDYTLSEDLTGFDPSVRKDTTVNQEPDNTDYMDWFTPLPVANIDSVTGTVVIPAGQLEVEVSVPTTLMSEMFKGKGSYYVTRVTLDTQDNSGYMIHYKNDTAFILQEDSFTYPKWGECSVQVWGKVNNVSYYEPIIDNDTSTVITYDFGYEENGGGSWRRITLRTKIIDDTPIEKLLFVPVEGDTPVDVENDTAVDLSTNLPYYKIKVNAGRRD